MSTKPTILVDVSNLAYRSFFVMPNLAYEGQRTGMFHGFLSSVRMLQKLGSNLVFAWDYGLPGQGPSTPSWRKALYAPYKAKRVKSSEASIVFEQMPELLKILQVLGYPNVAVPGLEADDVIGLLSNRPGQYLLYSHDEDLYQLLEGNRVRVLRREKAWRFITQNNIEERMGFPIDQFPAYLALGGDKSDNIRPLPRCGAAGALSLVQMGANPDTPYEDQPSGAQIARFAEPWRAGTVKQAYQVAHIPRSPSDWRIKDLVKAYPLPKTLNRERTKAKVRLEQFLQFCSQYGLLVHIAQRRKFFEEANDENNVGRET